jgi:hypothetical protein
VYGHNHITIQGSQRGVAILAPPNVHNTYADVFRLDNGEAIAGRLERWGWRRRPSYGFSGPGAAVYIMSGAITDGELWLEIRGPKPHLVRAALDPLEVELNANGEEHTVRTKEHPIRANRTVSLTDVTAHPLADTEVYLPNAQIGTIVAARDDTLEVALCYVHLPDGMIDMYRSTDLKLVTGAAPVTCPCGQHMAYQGLVPRTIRKGVASLPTDWRPRNYEETSIRVVVLSAVKVWQCRCGRRSELPVERAKASRSAATMQHAALPATTGVPEGTSRTLDNTHSSSLLPHHCYSRRWHAL